MHFTVAAETAGRHVLKLVMVDPAIAVQKIVIHNEDLPHSYFGPPENTATAAFAVRSLPTPAKAKQRTATPR
jgi:hypothetical protein